MIAFISWLNMLMIFVRSTTSQQKIFSPSNINSGALTNFCYDYQVGFKYNNSTVYMANKHKNCIEKLDLVASKK